MLKFLIAGIWGALMTGTGIFVGEFFGQGSETFATTKAKKSGIEQTVTELTGAPIIVDGKVLGYLVFRIRSQVDTSKLPNAKFEISPFLISAAFEVAYEFYQNGIQTIAPHDLEKISQQIANKTNEKLGSNLVTDVEMEQFNYVPSDKVRQNIFSPK